jgi:hypothetical protein
MSGVAGMFILPRGPVRLGMTLMALALVHPGVPGVMSHFSAAPHQD